MRDLWFVWLEITGKCQLSCEHCYADSGPTGGHGSMTREDWVDVLDQAASLGVRMVQFICGEPTLHPDLAILVNHALCAELRVEIFSNVVHVPPRLWDVFGRPGVRLATSYYTDDAGQHESITMRRGSYARTRANITEALRRSIPLRVGVIDVRAGQRVEQARAELVDLGVVDMHTDQLRQVGRGVRDRGASMSELCGHCAQGVVAVSPGGEVRPCVFARWMPLGNVRNTRLAEILTGSAMERAQSELGTREPSSICDPRCCPNTMCDPQCSPSCSPSCQPAGNCRPSGNCAPNYQLREPTCARPSRLHPRPLAAERYPGAQRVALYCSGRC